MIKPVKRLRDFLKLAFGPVPDPAPIRRALSFTIEGDRLLIFENGQCVASWRMSEVVCEWARRLDAKPPAASDHTASIDAKK